jgi:ABC-type Fe3+/spermidine/putrescine transport system ATPase subunit
VESAAVRLDGIRKDFGGVTALSGVTLDIERRQFVTLLGPSGCGKTTLLRIIAGLETPTAGEVYFGDERVTHRPPQARPLGFAFQRYALFPHLTVLENVAFGRRNVGSAPSRCSSSFICRTSPTACRRRSAAGRRSVSRSPARLRPSQACCSSTSR